MTVMSDQESSSTTNGWNTYWQGIRDSDSASAGGFGHPGFATLWTTAVTEFLAAQGDSNARILDIGTGNGAVLEALGRVSATQFENVSCIDISAAAIDYVKQHFPGVTGIVADAKNIPLEGAQFDLITSQFGIEYAGPDAIDEAVRLLSPGGSLLFLMHIQPGALHNDCAAAMDALRRTRDSRFIELSRDLFETGFAAVGGADRIPYDAAAKTMNPAIRELEAVLTEHGEHVAGDSIVTLHSTVQNMHSRMQHYDPAEVFAWLDLMQSELAKHEARMSSMHEASLDADAFKKTCERLESLGVTIERAQATQVQGEELPLAWLLQATLPKAT
jgi:SAM-dependent methyltransferase